MNRTIADVMTRNPITIGEGAPFKDIALLLTTNCISALPVVDPKGIPVGIVSEADLLLKEAYPDAEHSHTVFERTRRRRELDKAAGLTAEDLMSSPVHTIGLKAHLGEAARIMHDRGVKRLPVIDETGRLVGIVSRGDLLKAFTRPDSEIVHEVREGVMLNTLWMDPSGIEVVARDGVVSLFGEVDRKSDIPILIRLIHGVDGVVGVNDRLSFRYDDTRSMAIHSWDSPHWVG
jgi:CBS domain-containing protein